DFTAATPITTPATGLMLTKTATLAAGSTLPQGAVLPNGMVIPATAPGMTTTAPLVLPAGTRILGKATLGAGSAFAAGSAFPQGTDLMGTISLPAASASWPSLNRAPLPVAAPRRGSATSSSAPRACYWTAA